MVGNSDPTIDDIKADILLNIIKRARPPIHKKHISCDKFIKNIPRRLQGLAKQALKELILTDKFVLKRPSKKGYEKCSLNHKKIGEILNIPQIKENIKNDEFLKKRIANNFNQHLNTSM